MEAKESVQHRIEKGNALRDAFRIYQRKTAESWLMASVEHYLGD